MDKPWKTPPKQIKGLKTWCETCRTEVRFCLKNGKDLAKCENPQDLSYRVVTYHEGSIKRDVRRLGTRVLEDAISQAIVIRKEVKSGVKKQSRKSAHAPEGPRKEIEKPQVETTEELNMIEAMSYHISSLNGERGYDHMKHKRSEDYVADVKKNYVLFGKSLSMHGIEVEKMKADDIGDREVSFFHSYLINDKGYGANTYNRAMTQLRGLIIYLNKHEGQKLENPFSKVQKKYAETKINLIEPEEFQKLLSVISKENSTQVLSTGEKKEHYHDFLKTAFKLALLCGLRREQLVTLRYSDVREDKEGNPELIVSKNIKVNRIMAGKDGKERSIPTPVTPQLRSLLLNELNYMENRGSDKFLIAGDTTLNRQNLMDMLSRSFSHFWKHTGNPKDVNFADCRKTFINRMQAILGDSSRLVTGHSEQSASMLDKHYLSKDFFAKLASAHSLFPEIDEMNDKASEIKKVRAKKKKDISIER